MRWDLIADPRKYQKGFKEAEGITKRFGGTVTKVGALAAGAFAAVGFAGLIKGAKSSIDAASDLNETISKTNVIFGSSAKEIRKWSQGSARSMGLSRQEALASAASFGDMFQQLKVGRPQAVNLSKSMVQLASDFASFHNADITEVLEAQSAAFRGEYDALQRFIPNISAARVEQVALNQTHKDSAKDLTAADKALATYTIMMKDGKRAVGDFARTSDGAANQQRILKAEVDNMKASIGQALIGPFTAVVKLINEGLIPAFEKWWKDHGPKVRDMFGKAAEKAKDIWTVIHDNVIPILKEFADDTLAKVRDGLDKMAKSWEDNHEAIIQLGRDFKDLKPAWDFLVFIIGKLATDEIPGLITQIGWFGRAWDLARKVAITAFQRFYSAVISFEIRILQAMLGLVSSIPGGKRSGWGQALQRGIDQLSGFRRDFNAQMDGLKNEEVTVTAKGVWVPPKGMGSLHGIVGAAGGGPISGPGTSTSDSIPAMLSTGEHVLSAREVTGLGGHRAVEAMRRSARGFAAGGAVTPHMRLPSADGFAGAIGASIGRLAAAIDRLTIKVPIEAANIPHAPGAWKLATAFLSSVGVPYNVISTFRPGARTHASGRQSYHALNRAVDLTGPNMLAIWQALTRTNPTELIYSRAPYYKSSRGWRPIGALDPITKSDHFSHVHAAYKRGGRIPEDVFGVGRSGRTYGFHGGETVTPKGGITLRIESGGSRMDNLLVEVLREAVRARGGNVQTVLGRG